MAERNDNQISEVTRPAVIDHFTTSRISWAGRYGDDEFLGRLYDLTELPSGDRRYRDAAGDIHQHTVMNNDWAPDWVFYDGRFRLLHGSDAEFLRFLCETIHPVVRPSTEEARELGRLGTSEMSAIPSLWDGKRTLRKLYSRCLRNWGRAKKSPRFSSPSIPSATRRMF
jgi:AbiJ N-terminal domain 3